MLEDAAVAGLATFTKDGPKGPPMSHKEDPKSLTA